jgi:hypothetical protein
MLSGREHFFPGKKITSAGQFVAHAMLLVFVDCIWKPAGCILDSTESETIYQPVLYITSFFLANGWPSLQNLQSLLWPVSAMLILFLSLGNNFICADVITLFILVNELPSSNHSSVWSAITTNKNQSFRRTRRISNLAVFILGDKYFPRFLSVQLNCTGGGRVGLLFLATLISSTISILSSVFLTNILKCYNHTSWH